jgi:hypothetical protein
VQWAVPAFDYQRHPLDHLVSSTQSGLAGLGVLLGIHALLARFYPQTDEWERE